MTHENVTLCEALDQAYKLLTEKFGDPDQQAFVTLAGLIYSSHARDDFLQHRTAEPPYAGGPTI